jgi:hypothetical protein
MAKGKKHTPEQIVSPLRQIEVAVANGKMTPGRPDRRVVPQLGNLCAGA